MSIVRKSINELNKPGFPESMGKMVQEARQLLEITDTALAQQSKLLRSSTRL